MRAWLLPGFTGIESMVLGDAPAPRADKGQIVLAMQFASLNPADRYLSIGQYPAKPAFPHILGRDGVGTVTAIGEGVIGIRPGDMRLILRSDVGVTRWGTLAERVAVAAEYAVEVPPGWSLDEAAAAPLVYLTAWQALMQWNDLPREAVVLVSGASGGVGVATVQLAAALGHKVVALSRSAEKSARLRQLGAAITVDPQDKEWPGALKRQLADRRVDLAVDNIGGEGFHQILDVMAMHGRISVVGRLAGPVPHFNTGSLFFRRLRIGGVAVGTYTSTQAAAAWQSVVHTLATTGARPVIDRIFPLEEVPAAFARLAQGPMGKVLIRIGA